LVGTLAVVTTRRDTEVPRWLPRAALSVALVVLAVLAMLWVVQRLRSLLFMVFVALFVAVALEPGVAVLVRRGWKRSLATAVVFVGAMLAVGGFVAALVPLFIDQAIDLSARFPGYVAAAQRWLESQDLIDSEIVAERINAASEDLGSLLSEYGARVAGGVFAFGNTVLSAVFQFVTVLFFSWSMVSEGPKMRRTVLSFLPPTRQREALWVWEIAVDKTGGYIYSRLILAAVSAVFSAIIFSVLGLPSVVALSLWVGLISQFVPVVGAYLAGILPAMVALFDSPIKALWVVVAIVGYQQIENFLVAPRITAKTMAIHPAVSIAAVVAGASLLGATGAVLALPVAATIQATLSTVLQRHQLVDSLEEGPTRPTSGVEQAVDEPVHAGEGLLGQADGKGVEPVRPAGKDGELG
jgi:predicted PurR-regulated permease PerM